MEIPDYTSAIGRRLTIKAVALLGYSLTILGLGIFIPIRYHIYSAPKHPNCQFGDFKTNTYIISVIDILTGLILASFSAIQLIAIREWERGKITTHEFWTEYFREYNSSTCIILFILQLSVIGFVTSSMFRVFNPCECDLYLYYSLIANVDIFYNIVLIGVVCYMVGYLVLGILYGIYEICRGYCINCYGNDFIRLIGNFGLYNGARLRRQIAPTNNDSPRITLDTSQNILDEPSTSNTNTIVLVNQEIPKIMPELLVIDPHDDCVICIEPQNNGVKFGNCSHWVCQICWSRLMYTTNPVCPLCRAQII
jgi:hypothetical protein